jgi:hypothetical protein
MDSSENAYEDAGFTIPKPFAAQFIPRSEERRRIVKEQWEMATREGYELRGTGGRGRHDRVVNNGEHAKKARRTKPYTEPCKACFPVNQTDNAGGMGRSRLCV